MQTVRAHYDGIQVLLDEPLPLKKNDLLLVTVLQETIATDNDIAYAALQDSHTNDFLTKEEIAHYLSLK